jgi:hypothetical protein
VRILTLFIACAMAITFCSCSQQGNPVTAGSGDGEREAMVMYEASNLVFGNDPPASDCDVATVVRGPFAGGANGSAFVDYYGNSCTNNDFWFLYSGLETGSIPTVIYGAFGNTTS